jgi:heparanase 1
MLKSLSILLFFCLLDLFPGSFESGSITVDFDRVSATTGDGYISFNFDWHLNSEEPPAWYNSSVLVINLTNPKLIYLASQLSPGHLRVGGSEEDVAIYDIGAHRPCVEGFCMSMDRWHELVDFCQKAKIRLVFGLNAMYGRSNSTSHWDPSNAKSLLNYTASNKMPVYGFELGNELEHKVTANVMAEDYVTLRYSVLNI